MAIKKTLVGVSSIPRQYGESIEADPFDLVY